MADGGIYEFEPIAEVKISVGPDVRQDGED